MTTNTFAVSSSVNKWDLWHSRLGHPHAARLEFMFRNQLLPESLNLKDFDELSRV
ncbi:hypothetical protein LINPERPRIM_LOCUS14262, partial [Linum perenne]